MAKTEEPDNLPASDNQVIQEMLEYAWMDAISAARQGMLFLRTIHPELSEHMPEAAAVQISSALDNFETAMVKLHNAGRTILGSETYDAYLQQFVDGLVVDPPQTGDTHG